MTRYNGELFADAQFTNVLINISFAQGETQKDIMPLLLKKDFNYLYKAQIFPQGKSVNLIVNGIEYSSGGVVDLENVLVETLIMKNPTPTVATTIPFNINYCL